MVSKDLIRKYALANAYQHEGKANPGAVLGKLIAEDNSVKAKIKEIMPDIQKIIKEVEKIKKEDQEKELKKTYPELFEKRGPEEKKLPDLPNTEKGIVMRFEPSPSGPLHIGHAYVLSINSELCRKYRGKMILRISDTNPDNIYVPAYEEIPLDAKWVTKDNISEVVIQSDRMKTYYKYAEEAIKSGIAYVCTCPAEKWHDLMVKKIACPCRDLSVEKNTDRWKKMFSEFKEGDAVVRIKTDIEHKNPAMRDWPALRINETEHPRQKKKYKVWPLMNFAVAVDDHDLGITHAVRGKDHMDNEKKQRFLYEKLGWQMPYHLYLGRIQFKDIEISCSKTRPLIESGKYEGWDDVRLPFLRALKRRGYQPDAFIQFAVDMGVTENDKHVSGDEYFDKINSFNRRILDADSDRYFFIANPVALDVEKMPNIKTAKVKIHPEKKETRTIKVTKKLFIPEHDYEENKGKEIGLKELFNVKLSKDGKKSEYTDSEIKEIQHIQWVSEDNIETEILMPAGGSLKGLAEANIKKLKAGDIIQFERVGFVRLDSKSASKMIFAYGHK